MTIFKNAVLCLDQRHDLNDCNATIDVDGHSAIAEVVVRMEGQADDSPELVAFAGRLVACYNLLDGYPTEELEGVTLSELVTNHAELTGAALIAAYTRLFVESGATNYLEVRGERPELGPFTITLQRAEGLTPAQKLAAMTEQRDVLLDALHAVQSVANSSEGIAGWHKNGLKSRLELLANHHKREQELAEELADATRQCGVMAELLRDARKYITALGKPEHEIATVQIAVSRIDTALAGKLPDAWLPIKIAPRDGRKALVYRPLAENSGDERIAVKRLTGGRSNHCWDKTVPPGETPCNPTDGACHVTHWMPLPDDPVQQGGESCALEPRSSSPA